jgi:branched-chain amino acid transport system ATP-binding protein
METISAGISSRAASSNALMSVDGLEIAFGGIVALDGVSFDLEAGEVLGLIGPNGAGKTTLFNCISGLYAPARGDIRFEGRSILALAPHRRTEIGIARTFQNLALFRSMPAIDNVRIGMHARSRSDVLSDALGLPGVRRQEERLARWALEILEFLGLSEAVRRPAEELPLGLQKRVELARALAAGPKLLLLDEPAGGLDRGEVEQLARIIRKIRDEWAVTVLLVEHHMPLVMSTCDRVAVLDFGRKIAEGTPEEVRADAQVVRAYLGTAAL